MNNNDVGCILLEKALNLYKQDKHDASILELLSLAQNYFAAEQSCNIVLQKLAQSKQQLVDYANSTVNPNNATKTDAKSIDDWAHDFNWKDSVFDAKNRTNVDVELANIEANKAYGMYNALASTFNVIPDWKPQAIPPAPEYKGEEK